MLKPHGRWLIVDFAKPPRQARFFRLHRHRHVDLGKIAVAVLDITHHTASVYAEVKSKVAYKYLAKTLRKDRPKYIEEWVDKATGQKLAIDENDLWMCAQAKERDLVFVTADARMKRITDADPDVRLLVI